MKDDFYKSVYFDYAASTPIAPEVLESFITSSKRFYGNSSSRSHSFGWAASEAVTIAREQIAELINASPEKIIFFPSATIANNVVVSSFRDIPSYCSETEHSSVLAPISCSKQFFPTKDFNSLPKEVFVSRMLVNNETGDLNQLPHLDSGSILHTDASQAGAKVKIDVDELGCDFLTLSSHKMYGPKGAAALYAKDPEKLKALYTGGAHEQGLSSGTLNVPAIAAFGEAAKLASEKLSSDMKHLKLLFDRLLSGLPVGVQNTLSEQHCHGIVNIRFPGVANSMIISELTGRFAISTGSACSSAEGKASHVLLAMGLSEEQANESIRISFGRYTTLNEIDELALCLTELITSL